MLNDYVCGRTNYFAVKDKAKFRAWATSRNLNVIDGEEGDVDKEGKFAITPDAEDWTNVVLDDDGVTYKEINLFEELRDQHLLPGETAIFLTVGHCKLRYVFGFGHAVRVGQPIVHVSLDDIYEKAASAFGISDASIGLCEY